MATIKIECEAKIHCSLKGTSLSTLFWGLDFFFPSNAISYTYTFSIGKSK